MRVQAHEFIYEEEKKSSLFQAHEFIYGAIHPSPFILHPFFITLPYGRTALKSRLACDPKCRGDCRLGRLS